jgi:hypothetical protein
MGERFGGAIDPAFNQSSMEIDCRVIIVVVK